MSEELDEKAFRILEFFLFSGDCPIESIAPLVPVPVGMAKYHRDVLLEKGLIVRVSAGIDRGGVSSDDGTFDITPKGREYVGKERGRQNAN
jgi:hypothetical protein